MEATAALERFRAEVRAWLTDNFPVSLKHKARMALEYLNGAAPENDLALWKKNVAEKGWGTPTWPVEYGGGGLSPREARVLAEEMARAGAFNPLHVGMGVTMIGPTILDYGTEEQKREHLPRIARGMVRWCVGYSEPNAGSDLASLQMRCEDKGTHWLINGSKIWTSGAHLADWCGALVRTDPRVPKHLGISFLLIDMRQRQIEARPIRLIGGSSSFCETFFTDATAPKSALLGELNDGWTVGKRLLQHERASQTGEASGERVSPLEEIAKRYVPLDAQGRIANRDLRSRIARNVMDGQAHRLTLARVAAERKEASGASNAASVLKNAATDVTQTRMELLLEIMGNQALGWEGAGFSREEIEATRGWLMGKAMSIYGGSAEIQNNIIAKRILGLADHAAD